MLPLSDRLFHIARPSVEKWFFVSSGKEMWHYRTAQPLRVPAVKILDKNPVSESLFTLAGSDLKEELQKLKCCRMGKAKLTEGFHLAALFIIHTVEPTYKGCYHTAAASSLYSCYRNVLQLVQEQLMSSVGFWVIDSAKQGYPLADATHIALYTVRRL